MSERWESSSDFNHFLFRVRGPSNCSRDRFLQLYLRGCLQATSLLLYCSGVAFSPCCAIACSSAFSGAGDLLPWTATLPACRMYSAFCQTTLGTSSRKAGSLMSEETLSID